MSDWISVTDQPMPMDVPILVAAGEIVTVVRVDDDSLQSVGFDGYVWEYDFQVGDITHWMPLPNLPD